MAASGDSSSAPIDVDAPDVLTKSTEIDDLIADLCLKAPNEDVKFCLRSYHAGRTLKQIERDINRYKKDILVATSIFLRIPNSAQLKKTKEELSHLILCRIQNLLPDNCNICSNRYRIELEDAPLLECAICGQGVHEKCWLNLLNIDNTSDRNMIVNKYINPLNLPGIHYLCSVCEDDTIPKGTDRKATVPEPPKSQGQPLAEDKIDSSQAVIQTGNVDETEEENNTNEDDLNEDDLNKEPVMNYTIVEEANEKSTHQETTSTGTSDDTSKSTTIKSDLVCRYFRRGTCKHGLRGADCRYKHPQMCRKFTQHGTRQPNGCNLGKRCKQFHPLMCLDSLKTSECFNEKCSFNHIKGTRRQPKLIRNNQQECSSSSPAKSHRNNSDSDLPAADSNISAKEPVEENQTGHFLEIIRLMKAEILSTMNQQIASLTAQIQSIQPSVHRIVPPPQMPYPQHVIPQTNPQLMFTPPTLRGTQQPTPQMRIQTPPRI